MFQRRGLAALLPIALLVLSGCSADRGTQAAPLPPLRAAEASASPSLLPSLAPPPSWSAALGNASPAPAPATVALPAEAAANTPQGASALARFYFEELLRAQVTQDTRAVRSLAAESCGTCAGLSDAIDKLRAKQQRLTGPFLDLLSADAPAFGYGAITVDVQYKVTAFDIVDADGNVAAHSDAQKRDTFIVTLQRSGPSWLIGKIQVP